MSKKESFTLDPLEVRRIATSLGIPPDAELPIVQVEDYEDNPALLPPGVIAKGRWVIILPRDDLAEVAKDTYTLGREALNALRHELRHYKLRIEGKEWKLGLPPREELAWELDAELLSGSTESLPRIIAAEVMTVSENYKIPFEEAWDIVKEEASKFGISDKVFVKARRLLNKYYREHPEEKIE